MHSIQYKQLHVRPAASLKGTLVPPASKSYSARAVLAASLAPGTSTIENVADSHNVKAMIECCRALGAVMTPDGPGRLRVAGVARPRDGVILSPGNSGIVLRLLMGAAARSRGVTFASPYTESLGRRGNSEMVEALRALGVVVTAEGADGRLPITLDGAGAHGGEVGISGRRSSQFLSGLLYLGGLLDEPLAVHVTDELKAWPMVRTTLAVLARAGVAAEAGADLLTYLVRPGGGFQPAAYACGSDPASVAALLAIATAVESDVEIRSHGLEELGGVLDHLRAVGARIDEDGTTLRVRGGGPLRARDFDGSQAPDAVLPLAALAAHAEGTSRFTNIEHIRYKECDRISDFRRELTRVGIDSGETRDELIVHGSPGGVPGGVTVTSHYDHAVVMAMSLVALRSRRGLTIGDPQYVAQTYPAFFEDLRRLGATVAA
ncbi:3-phosphoshikimate 1-carboxyvinyltransferase [Nonomuraea sp. NPDC050783]|uniref:3-phosphoshikimate 1-carboxyvinyltransferase n=1 Tax=Nonomuraea sp. NPDC050783 TaxID=3154634 RepID=UPI003467A0B5